MIRTVGTGDSAVLERNSDIAILNNAVTKNELMDFTKETIEYIEYRLYLEREQNNKIQRKLRRIKKR